MKSFTVALLLGCTLSAFSQSGVTVDSLRSILRGKEKKEWVATGWVLIMGTSANNQCKDGESYIFRDDGIVERKRCVDGRIVKDTLAWKVEHRGDDNVLSIGTSEYQARVRIDKDSEIHLRTLVFDKAKPSQEIILKYEKD